MSTTSDQCSRRTGWMLFLGLLMLSGVLFSGRLGSSDEILMAFTTRSIATKFSLHFPETYGQTFTGYGLGMPLAGVPFFGLEWLLRTIGVIGETANISLLPLASAFLFALLGVLVAGSARRLGGGEQTTPRQAACSAAVALVASPFLPVSTMFYSDLLAAVGLAGMVWATLRPEGRGRLALAFVFALAAILARTATLPLVLLVLTWIWSCHRFSAVFWSGVAGTVAGLGVWLAQNVILRGAPFATGYEGQEFTTPLLTGLFGLLLSPERGVFVFFPVIVFAFAGTVAANNEQVRRYQLLAAGVLGFSLVFHARFWTWHGGWTVGPRFLLPALAVAMPLVVRGIVQLGEFSVRKRNLFVAALVWGLAGAWLYTLFSPIAVWNELYSFHQVESRWLFEPQLSLWTLWPALLQDGAFEPQLLRGVMSSIGMESRVIICVLIAFCFLIPLLGILRKSSTYFDGSLQWFSVGFGKAFALLGVLLILGFSVLGFVKGPRGWEFDGMRKGYSKSDTYPALRLSSGGTYYTFADFRPHGTYTFYVKVRGAFRVSLDGKPILGSDDRDAPRRLAHASVEIAESGPRLLAVEFDPPASGERMLNLYWTWPGEGTMLRPVGGEYTLPRELSPLERAATFVWRRKIILLAAGLAFVLLLIPLDSRKRDIQAG